MTFLTPIPAIIAAAITVPLLLLYYFLKLRRQAVRVSSTLLWERAIKDLQVNTPFRWLRPSVLLLLQLLILAAFLLALARPAIDDRLGAASRVIILIDRSASMSAKDGLPALLDGSPASTTNPPTRLDQAKREAINLIAQLTHSRGWLSFLGSPQDAAKICIADYSSSAAVRTSFISDVASLREAVEGIVPTDQPGNLSAATRLVQGIALAQSDDQEEARPITLFVISDGSFEPDIERPAAGVPDIRFVQVGPKPTPQEFSNIPGFTGVNPPDAVPGTFSGNRSPITSQSSPSPIQPRNNLGITAISARRDTDTPSLVRLFVRVQNAAEGSAVATLRLTLNGQLVATKEVTVQGLGSPASSQPSPPPEAAATFELDTAEGGLAAVWLSGSDLLHSDDSAAVMLRPASKPKVLVVAREGKPDGFLLNVLEVMDLPVLVSADPVYYEQLAAAPRDQSAASSAPSSLADWDLVIFDRYRPEHLPSSASLSIGAGLPIPGVSMLPIAASSDPSTPEAQPTGGFRDPTSVARFVTWRRTHALMQSVNLDGVVVAPPMNLSLPTSASYHSTVLAWGRAEGDSGNSAGGPLIALIEPTSQDAGVGTAKRLLVAFELVQSNWPVEDSFPPFIMNAVEHLSAKGGGLVGRSFSTTDPITVTALRSAREISASGPQSLIVPVPSASPKTRPSSPESAPSPPTGVDTPLGALSLTGVYQLTGVPQDSIDNFVAVNLCDNWESRLQTATSLDIPGSGSSRNTVSNESRQELWQWFIAAALFLLTLEWLVFAKRIKA